MFISDLAKTAMFLALKPTLCLFDSVITGSFLLFTFNAKDSRELRRKIIEGVGI